MASGVQSWQVGYCISVKHKVWCWPVCTLTHTHTHPRQWTVKQNCDWVSSKPIWHHFILAFQIVLVCEYTPLSYSPQGPKSLLETKKKPRKQAFVIRHIHMCTVPQNYFLHIFHPGRKLRSVMVHHPWSGWRFTVEVQQWQLGRAQSFDQKPRALNAGSFFWANIAPIFWAPSELFLKILITFKPIM